jgi:hypothetical protein
MDKVDQTGQAGIEVTEGMVRAGRAALLECEAYDADAASCAPTDVVRLILLRALAVSWPAGSGTEG